MVFPSLACYRVLEGYVFLLVIGLCVNPSALVWFGLVTDLTTTAQRASRGWLSLLDIDPGHAYRLLSTVHTPESKSLVPFYYTFSWSSDHFFRISAWSMTFPMCPECGCGDQRGKRAGLSRLIEHLHPPCIRSRVLLFVARLAYTRISC